MVRRTSGSNVYLVPGDPDIIVDAGFPGDERKLLPLFAPAARRAGTTLVLTHYHIDHAGPAAALKKKRGVRLAAHIDEARVIEGEEPLESYRLDPLRRVYYSALKPFLFTYRHAEVDFKLRDGDRVGGDGGFRVIHVPGHTRGSIVLHREREGILFTGDTIRNERGVLEGPPPRFSTDPGEAFRGIREKLLNLGCEAIMPGHGEPVTGGAGRLLAIMMEGAEK